MKQLVFAALAIAWLASCGPSAETKRLQQQNDSLARLSSLKDSHMTSLVTSLIDIQDNLQAIKEKENIITVNVSTGDKVNASMKEQINRDIELIYDLMIQNKEKIAQLESKLKNAAAQNSNLNKLIAGLNKQIEQQEAEIMRLHELLAEKDIEIRNLNMAIFGLKGAMDSLGREHQTVKGKLQQTTEVLETAYYVIGSKKELKDKEIITSDGLFASKKIMQGNYEADYFTRVNVTQIAEIPLMAKRAKILSTHPQQSYKLTPDAQGLQVLQIVNKADFWSVSKYLVVQVN